MGTESTGGLELPDSFEVETSRHDGRWLVAVRGELDLAAVETLEAALGEVSGSILLDLRGISFIDSAGLTLLLRATRNGCTIGEVSPEVVRLFRVTGFEDELRRPATPG
jgi:anti-anti-sigma factor